MRERKRKRGRNCQTLDKLPRRLQEDGLSVGN